MGGQITDDPAKKTQRFDRLFMGILKADDVATGIHYPVPVHLQPPFTAVGENTYSLPVTETVTESILSLPIYVELGESGVIEVCDAIKRALA